MRRPSSTQSLSTAWKKKRDFSRRKRIISGVTGNSYRQDDFCAKYNYLYKPPSNIVLAIVMGSKWKPVKQKCTKFRCDTDEGESLEFEVCIKNGKNVQCKKVK